MADPRDTAMMRESFPSLFWVEPIQAWTEEPGRLQPMESLRVGHD